MAPRRTGRARHLRGGKLEGIVEEEEATPNPLAPNAEADRVQLAEPEAEPEDAEDAEDEEEPEEDPEDDKELGGDAEETNAAPSIWSKLKAIYQDTDMIHISLLVLLVSILIVQMVLTALYFARAWQHKNMSLEDPGMIQQESYAYQAMRSMDFWDTNIYYPLWVVVFLACLSLGVLMLAALYIVIFKNARAHNAVLIAWVVLAAVVGGSSIAIIIVFFVARSRQFQDARARMARFNDHIDANIVNNSAFLNILSKPPSMANDSIRDAFSKMPNDADVDSMSKAMFTVVMYKHYLKLSGRGNTVYDALQQFSVSNILLNKLSRDGTYRRNGKWSDFLFNKYTYIKNIENEMTYLVPRAWLQRKNDYDDATKTVVTNVTLANSAANRIVSGSTQSSFESILYTMFFMYWLPWILVAALFFFAKSRNTIQDLVKRFMKNRAKAIAKGEVAPPV